MLRLGTKVRYRGRDAMVIARTMGGTPSYDLRLIDGTLVKYASEAECEVVAEEAGVPSFHPGATGSILHLPR